MLSQAKQDTQTERKHKSVKLTSKEVTKLKALADKYPSLDVAAEAIGLNDRFILSRIMKQGSASSDTIALIRSVIGTAA